MWYCIRNNSATLVVLLWNTPIMAIILTAVVSSLTVGGKAIGKKIAIKRSENIVFLVGKFISSFKFERKR